MDVIFPEMRYSGMETSLQKRLRIRLDLLGMNPYQAALKAGLGQSFVRDILRGKTRSPNAENLAKLAAALDTTPDWFMSVGGEKSQTSVSPPIAGLPVINNIQAGNWLDQSIIDDSQEYEIIPVARDPRFPEAKQYALKIRGDSMDREYPEGTYVTCVDYADSGATLKPGRILHVERHNGPLVEVTLKALEVIDGEALLVPRSSNPRHQPIKLEGEAGSEIIIRGVVIGSYRRTEW